ESEHEETEEAEARSGQTLLRSSGDCLPACDPNPLREPGCAELARAVLQRTKQLVELLGVVAQLVRAAERRGDVGEGARRIGGELRQAPLGRLELAREDQRDGAALLGQPAELPLGYRLTVDNGPQPFLQSGIEGFGHSNLPARSAAGELVRPPRTQRGRAELIG